MEAPSPRRSVEAVQARTLVAGRRARAAITAEEARRIAEAVAAVGSPDDDRPPVRLTYPSTSTLLAVRGAKRGEVAYRPADPKRTDWRGSLDAAMSRRPAMAKRARRRTGRNGAEVRIAGIGWTLAS